MIVDMTLDHALTVSRAMRPSHVALISSTRFTFDAAEFAIERYRTDGVKLAAVAADGTPVGIGGLQLTSPGVWTAWVLGTERWRECSSEVIWRARRLVRSMFTREICHRIQALCASDDLEACRYAELVGFHFEHVVRGIRKDGRSLTMFSILKEGL